MLQRCCNSAAFALYKFWQNKPLSKSSCSKLVRLACSCSFGSLLSSLKRHAALRERTGLDDGSSPRRVEGELRGKDHKAFCLTSISVQLRPQSFRVRLCEALFQERAPGPIMAKGGKKAGSGASKLVTAAAVKVQEDVWAQCDNPNCQKWRRLPPGTVIDENTPWSGRFLRILSLFSLVYALCSASRRHFCSSGTAT